jgi:hypothetical protein
MTKASDNAFPSLLILEGTEPSAPAASHQRLYIDSTSHKLKATNSSGTERDIEGGGIGAWTTYTPTWSTASGSPNLGSSTLAGRYKLIDANTVVIQIAMSIVTGGAWNAGSGNWIWALPAGMTTVARIQVGSGHCLDNGTTHFVCVPKVSASATSIGEVLVADSSGSKIMTNTLPVTWATGDQVNLSLLLEIA